MQTLFFSPFLVTSSQFCFFAVGAVQVTKQNITWVAAGFWNLVFKVNYVNTYRLFDLKTNLSASPFLPHFTFAWLKALI